MAGNDVAVSVEAPHGVFEAVEILASRVSFVAQHQPGLLPVAHGGCA